MVATVGRNPSPRPYPPRGIDVVARVVGSTQHSTMPPDFPDCCPLMQVALELPPCQHF